MKVKDIKVGENVRHDARPDDILIASVKQYGVLEPLLVRKDKSGYVLVAGHRRLAAAKQVGLTDVDVKVLDIEEGEVGGIQVTENAARKSLNAFEMLSLVAQQFTADELKKLAPATGASTWTKDLIVKVANVAAAFGLSKRSIITGARLATVNAKIKKAAEKGLLSLASFDILSRLTEERQAAFSDGIHDQTIEDSDVRRWVESNVERELKHAQFPTSGCFGCSFNTGMANLFGGKDSLGSCLSAPCWNKKKADSMREKENRVLNGNKLQLPVIGTARVDWNGKYQAKGKTVHLKLEGELKKLAEASKGKKMSEADVAVAILKNGEGIPNGLGYVLLKPEKAKTKALRGEPATEHERVDWAKRHYVSNALDRLAQEEVAKSKLNKDELVFAMTRHYELAKGADILDVLHAWLTDTYQDISILKAVGMNEEKFVKQHAPAIEAQYEEEKKKKEAEKAAAPHSSGASASQEDDDGEEDGE